MILTADYHTHTPYSHGKNTVAENVARAKELGLKEIAITDHGLTHIVFGVPFPEGGNGGGKPDFAMAGGNDVSKLDAALLAAREFVAGKA